VTPVQPVTPGSVSPVTPGNGNGSVSPGPGNGNGNGDGSGYGYMPGIQTPISDALFFPPRQSIRLEPTTLLGRVLAERWRNLG